MALLDFSKEKFDIIIQAGQSNSVGEGIGIVEKPYTVTDRVWYMHPYMYLELAQEYVMQNYAQSNYSLAFSQRYMDTGLLKTDRKLLILRSAVGATSFYDNHWTLNGCLYLHMLDMIQTALEMNPENRLVAFLWHQGETDAANAVSFDEHYHNLSALLSSVREKYAVPTLPFIAGDFVPHWKQKNEQYSAPIEDAIRAVCREAGYSAFVETTGLLSNAQDETHPGFRCDDIIHFCRKSIYELGYRYFDAFLKCI